MAIKKSQLYSTLWESCNALRGSMDASQYKDYVLMILFVKYLSDKAGQPGLRIKVPEGCYFKDFVALKQNPKIGEEINKKLEKIQENNKRTIGDLTLPNFNDESKLGKNKTMVDTLSRLIAVFEKEELDFSKNRAADDDLLGDAYEYLMKNFAAESGKSKGQFYTPAEVSRIMAKVLRLNELNNASNVIYDPTCGSGSLLIRALAEAGSPKVSLRGQEKDSTTASLAKLNVILHSIPNAQIRIGDTLNDPQFKTSSNALETFDACVANPPFSQKNWIGNGMENDPFGRWSSNLLPPPACGDYAFLLHLIHSMKPDTGRGACILPHGVLFRGNAEYNIRKDIIDKHYIKGIIGLPPNIFFGTGIPASIIIIDKQDTNIRQGIFFIDAKDGYAKDGAKNRLREQDIKRIIDAWQNQQDIPHYCRFVSYKEIAQNDYNLNIPRYIHPIDKEIQHNINSHLHGSLPAYDIDQMNNYWTACPTLKDSLFSPLTNSSYSLIPNKEDIAQTIDQDSSYIQQKEAFSSLLQEWREEVLPQMLSVEKDCTPKHLIVSWSQSLLDKLKSSPILVDPYNAYNVLLNFWTDTIQDDCYMISNDGWTYPKVSALSYESISCDLLPLSIVLNEFFQSQTKQLSDLNEQKELLTDKIKDLEEKFIEQYGEETYNEKYNTLTKIKTAYKTNKDPNLKSYIDYQTKLKTIKDEIKKSSSLLTNLVNEKYNTLTENEIRPLVVNKKWLDPIITACKSLMLSVTHNISTEVLSLVERYEQSLPDLTAQVEKYEKEVNNYLAQMGFTL